DQQEAPEEERFDVRAGVEDIAREDHAERQRADKRQGSETVVAAAPPARERPDGESEDNRGGQRAERRREREAVREYEPREGGGRDGVGVERQAAEDDPRSEQAGAAGEEQHLEEAPLHEREVEWSEHGALTIIIIGKARYPVAVGT